MKYIYKNNTANNQTVFLSSKNQDTPGIRTFLPGSVLELDYPGLTMYVPNILSCVVIGDENATDQVVEAPLPVPAPAPIKEVVSFEIVEELPVIEEVVAEVVEEPVVEEVPVVEAVKEPVVEVPAPKPAAPKPAKKPIKKVKK